MVSLLTTPETEIQNRLGRAAEWMARTGLDGMFLTHKPDIFYFSGTAQDAYLAIFQDHDPILFVKQYLPRALAETSISHVQKIDSIKEIPAVIREKNGSLPSALGLAFDVVPHREALFYGTLFKDSRLMDGTPVINACRQVKSDWEIRQLERSAALSKKTFDFISQTIEPGISEMEFCGRYETFSRRHGNAGKLLTRHYRAEGFHFHLLSGKSGGMAGALDSPVCGTGMSCAYPYGAGPKLLEKDEPILIDFGTALDGYHVDETRMFCMGKMEQTAMDACLASIEILYGLVDMMGPGVPMGEVFDACVRHAGKLGYQEQFLGLPGIKARFIGHGTGIELVESPVVSQGKKDVLLPGMVLAMEPKMIFKDRFAAGVESMVRIREHKAEFLTVTEHKVFLC